MIKTPISLKPGDTAAERAVLTTTVVNGTPTVLRQSIAEITGYDAIDLIVSAAVGICKFKVWWGYSASDTWEQDATIGEVTVPLGTSKAIPLWTAVTRPTADKLYIEASVCPAGATLTAWLQGRVTLG